MERCRFSLLCIIFSLFAVTVHVPPVLSQEKVYGNLNGAIQDFSKKVAGTIDKKSQERVDLVIYGSYHRDSNVRWIINSDLEDLLYTDIAAEDKKGKVILLDRRFVSPIEKTLGKQQDPHYDQTRAVEIGRALQARYLVTGYLHREVLAGLIILNLALIELKTRITLMNQTYKISDEQYYDRLRVPGEKPLCRLYMTTDPHDAEIRIENIGRAYNYGMELPCGRYLVRISRPNYETKMSEIELTSQNNSFKLALTRICKKDVKRGCEGGNVYSYDSCGNKTLIQECDSGSYCKNGRCCKKHDHKICYDDDVWWESDCDDRMDLDEACGSGQECKGGRCVPCKPKASFQCNEDGITAHWVDSCGNVDRSEQAQCPNGYRCKDGKCMWNRQLATCTCRSPQGLTAQYRHEGAPILRIGDPCTVTNVNLFLGQMVTFPGIVVDLVDESY